MSRRVPTSATGAPVAAGGPRLRVELTRRPDGAVVLRCQRPDGTATWQRHEGARAAFFPLHDLTHLAVEVELGSARGFYGLLAAGWDVGDFGAPWPRGPVPAESVAVEIVVGFLDAERAAGLTWSAESLNEKSRLHAASHPASAGVAAAWRELDDATLARVRARRAELFARWAAVPPGGTLALDWAAPEDGAG